jgi:uncharacterized DUF497 family protein
MRFDWDPAKHESNQRKRGFGFDIAALVFEGDTIELPDDPQDYGETRLRAIGEAGGVVLHVMFTDRGGVWRIISDRPANRKERSRWQAGP